MRSDGDYSHRLFFLSALLLALNAIWVTATTFINDFPSFEGMISSYRLLLSLFIGYYIRRYLTIQFVSNILFWFATINSIIILIQLIEALQAYQFLPDWLRYGWFYEVEDIEIWRKGGLLPSLQTSSLLAIVGLFIGARLKSFKLMCIVFPILCIAMLIGSRTFIPIALICIMYSAYKFPFLVLGWLIALVMTMTNLEGFWEFFELRFMSLHEVFLSFNMESDYSAKDTMQSYRSVSFFEILIGNGYGRYSEFGGQDPFYTRWLYQSGAPSLILLVFVLCLFAFHCGRYSLLAYFILIVALYHNIKGELFTSTGVFDIICILVFVMIYPKKINNPVHLR